MHESPIGRVENIRGTPVFGKEAEEIAPVDAVYLDNDTGRPEWLRLSAGSMRNSGVLVPVQGATFENGGIHVPYTTDLVKDSPTINSDEISEDTERELYAYYGLAFSQTASPTAVPEGAADIERDGDQVSVTRSEEELDVGTRQIEAGRVRVRKWVESEPVSAEVTLQHETARIEHVPVNEPVANVELGADEIEIPLTEERAVVDKEVVAKERVSVTKHVGTRQETVTEQVRKERVEVQDGDLERERSLAFANHPEDDLAPREGGVHE